MKRTVRTAVVGLASLCLALAGCSKGDLNNSADAGDGAKKYRVAYVARAQADSFAAWLANEMKAAAAKYPDITLDILDGEANDEKQNSMIENSIANKYDAIIVQPNNGEAQRPYVEKIVAAGIKTIITNPRIDGIAGASTIDANPYDQGAEVAKRALQEVPKDAKVVVLDGPAGNFHSTERRNAWQKEFFDKRSDVKILAENIANWNKDEALRYMEDWIIAHGQIDAVISMNDNMAAGALEATSSKDQYKNFLAYGVDGTPEACLLIKEGRMKATTLQAAGELAELNMQAVHDLLTGKEKEINKDIGTPVIDASNADKYIKMYTEAGLIK